MFQNIYENRRVLVTGHTGFKGSWLTLWLSQLGARVVGYSLAPPTKPSHFELLERGALHSLTGDVRDLPALAAVFREHRPEIVFHLAAQAIVRASYREPLETLASNVIGTAHVLEAARAAASVAALVIVTSDKCYENREGAGGCREEDPLGGYDPYSASKGCAELVTNCWRSSFFNPKDYGRTHGTLLASGRAGNVIGGGDWAADRLVPDIMRAADRGEKARIRNPRSTRPWQHVLEPLSGYLLLGQKLLEGRPEFAAPWNFGPSEAENMTVGEIVDQASRLWPAIGGQADPNPERPHEAASLGLDCSRARTCLQWLPVWTARQAVERTTLWYRAYYESREIQSERHLAQYVAEARQMNIPWAQS
jgi:CDP-glucose 4,6-dehydratase